MELMIAALEMMAPSGAVLATLMVKPQPLTAPMFTAPRFQVMVLPARTPFGNEVQARVAVSRFASRVSVIRTPVAFNEPVLE